MKKLAKLAGLWFLIPLVKYYLRNDRNYRYKGIRLKVLSGVFHPGLFFSTKLMARYVQKMELKNVQFLELGAGTGLISLLAAKKGAVTSASDISPLAIKNLFVNAALNSLNIQIIESDLFDNFPGQTFDFIIIQPPYYPKDPVCIEEYAWYCGSNFDFYRKLFSQIANFSHAKSQIFMMLSDDCNIETIKQIAVSHGYEMRKVFEKKIYWEWNFIFGISRIPDAEQIH